MRAMRRRPFLLLVLVLLLALALGLFSHTHRLRRLHPGPADNGSSMGVVAGSVQAVPTDLTVPYPVRLALEVQDMRDLDLSSKTFRAMGQIRLEWGKALQERISTGELDIARLLRFVNLVETWNSLLETSGPVQARPGDERFAQTLRFEGLFYVNEFDFLESPFLRVSLPLIHEVADDSLALEGQGLLLQPVRDTSRLIGRGVSMEGLVLDDADVKSMLRRSSDPLMPGSQRTLSRVVLQLRYHTEPLASFLKWILPLIVVMGVVLLAPSLDSYRDDLSFGLPSAGLLALVVLQESYRQQLPSTPYLTFLDELYATSYVVAIAIFLFFVWGGNQRARHGGEAGEAAMARVNRLGSVVQIASLLAYGVVVVLEVLN